MKLPKFYCTNPLRLIVDLNSRKTFILRDKYFYAFEILKIQNINFYYWLGVNHYQDTIKLIETEILLED